MQISTALKSKADRLVEQDRVTHVRGLLYEVQGDSDTYSVHLSYPAEASGACNCKSVAAICSHILAASIVYLADPPAVITWEVAPSTDPFLGVAP